MDLSPLIFSPLKLKTEDDESDIIDLDKVKNPEDAVYEWNTKIRSKLRTNYIVESEGALNMLMKWYIQSLKEDVVHLEDIKSLKPLIVKHLLFFKLYFTELNCCFIDNYLDNMEEILAVYIKLEVESVPRNFKRVFKKRFCHRVISMLNTHLMNKEDRVYQALMKVKLGLLSEESKDILNCLFRKILTRHPKDQSDLAFCRTYILYQKWKTFRKSQEWEKMDEVIYKLYDQSPESVQSNPTLKKILFPQSNSVLDTLIHFSAKHIIISEEYFKYMDSMKLQEETEHLSELREIELNDPILPDLVEDEEDREFNMAYNNFVQSMTALGEQRPKNNCDGSSINIDDEDDECQIVEVVPGSSSTGGGDLVHEILDDGEIEIIYVKKKDTQGVPQTASAPMSFLDSIDISDNAVISTEALSRDGENRTPNNLQTVEDMIEIITDDIELPKENPLVNSELGHLSQNVVTLSTNVPENIVVSQEKAVGNADAAAEPVSHNMEIPRENVTSSTSGSVQINQTPAVSLATASTNTDPTDKDNSSCDASSQVLILHAPSPCSVYSGCSVNMEINDDSMTTDRCSKSSVSTLTKTTSTNTQTDEFDLEGQSRSLGNCHCNAEACGRNYCHGIVAPFSDIPCDDDGTTTVEGTVYATVYADILQTCDSDEKEVMVPVPECEVFVSDDANSENCGTVWKVISETEKMCSTEQNLDAHINDSKDDENSLINESELVVEPSIPVQSHSSQHEYESEKICEDSVINNSHEGTVATQDINEASMSHDSNLVSESCCVEVSGNRSPVSVDPIVYKSPDTNNLSDIVLNFDNFVTPQSSSPNEYNGSSSVLCTSTDFTATYSIDDNFSDIQSKSVKLPCTSPDITSTSNEIQDLRKSPHQTSQEGRSEIFYDTVGNILGVGEVPQNQSYCSAEYSIYSSNVDNGVNNENVSQSNLQDNEEGDEIDIEEPMLMQNEESGGVCSPSTSRGICSPEMSLEYVQPEKMGIGGVIVETVRPIDDAKETEQFEEYLSGPITRQTGISHYVHPDTNFIPPQECVPQTPTSSSANSSSDIVSPAYERIDDFGRYFEENKNINLNNIDVSLPDKSILPNKPARNKHGSVGSGSRRKPSNSDLNSKHADEKVPEISRHGNKKRSRKETHHSVAKKVRYDTNLSKTKFTPENVPVPQGILKNKSAYDTNENTVRYSDHNKITTQKGKRALNFNLPDHQVKMVRSFPIGNVQVKLALLPNDRVIDVLSLNDISQKLQEEKEQSSSALKVVRVDYKTPNTAESDMSDTSNLPNTGQAICDPKLQVNSSQLNKGMPYNNSINSVSHNNGNPEMLQIENVCSYKTNMDNSSYVDNNIQRIMQNLESLKFSNSFSSDDTNISSDNFNFDAIIDHLSESNVASPPPKTSSPLSDIQASHVPENSNSEFLKQLPLKKRRLALQSKMQPDLQNFSEDCDPLNRKQRKLSFEEGRDPPKDSIPKVVFPSRDGTQDMQLKSEDKPLLGSYPAKRVLSIAQLYPIHLLKIKTPAEKKEIPNDVQGIAMQPCNMQLQQCAQCPHNRISNPSFKCDREIPSDLGSNAVILDQYNCHRFDNQASNYALGCISTPLPGTYCYDVSTLNISTMCISKHKCDDICKSCKSGTSSK